MRRIFLLIFALVPGAPAFAQRADIEPPLTNRPAGFSNIVGRYDDPQVEAAPTEVHIEEPITLRITITGTGPAKYEPRREHLRLFPEAWERDFYIEEMREEHRVDRAKRTWIFVYRLRPRHTKIDAISDISLVYYNPASAEKNKFETRYADSIKIVVKPRRETGGDTEVAPKIVPESFYQTAPIDIDRSTYSFGLAHLVAFLTVPPFACWLGAWAWKRYRPDESERRRRMRGQAAEQAVARLHGQAAPVWDIAARYLRERFDIAFEEPTPADVSAALRRRGFAKVVCSQWHALLQACDAQRFGHAPEPKTLTEDAARLIAALEADPCAR